MPFSVDRAPLSAVEMKIATFGMEWVPGMAAKLSDGGIPVNDIVFKQIKSFPQSVVFFGGAVGYIRTRKRGLRFATGASPAPRRQSKRGFPK